MSAAVGHMPLHDAEAADHALDLLRETGWLKSVESDRGMSHCVPHLLRALGWLGTVGEICDALPGRGAQFGELEMAATLANCGFHMTRVRMRLSDLDPRLMPCVFLPDTPGRATRTWMVALERASDTGAMRVFRPGETCIENIAIGSDETGTVLMFDRRAGSPDEDDRDRPDESDRAWFGSQLMRFRPLLRQIVITSVFLSLLSLAAPLFLMLVYDKVINAQATDDLYYILSGVVLAVLVETTLRYLRLQSTTWLGSRIDYIVSVAIFERLTALPVRFTERASVAAQLARIKSFESVREFFTGPLFLLTLDLPFSLILLAALAVIAGPIALIPIMAAAIYAIMAVLFRTALKRAVRAAARASSSRQRLLVETFAKLGALRTSGMTEAWYQRLRQRSGEASHASFRSTFFAAVIESVSHGILVLAGVATLAFGIKLVLSNEITVGALVAAMILTWRSLGPLQTICTMLPRLEQLSNSIDQVNRLMDYEGERRATSGTAAAKPFKGQVTLSNIGLRYSKDSDPVFAGLSIDAAPGQLVALTGSNGAGKSTILKLINRLYMPQAGSIRIDGSDIRQIDPVQLRRNVTYIPETPEFFTGTIEDNFRLIFPFISQEQLREALERAGAWDELVALPDGLGTTIGTGGIGALPSSLAYRLNLARAFISNASIMLFDEMPYAVLNSSTGEVFKQFLSEARGLRTVFFVTHRDDYVRMADQIVVLQENARPRVSAQRQIQSQNQLSGVGA